MHSHRPLSMRVPIRHLLAMMVFAIAIFGLTGSLFGCPVSPALNARYPLGAGVATASHGSLV